MMNPKAPGVYVYEVQSGARPIDAEAISTTAFIGYGYHGPVEEAIPINKWDDYLTEFGNISSESDSLGLAVWAYFLNGGKKAIIYRLGGGACPARLADPLKNEKKQNVMMIEAKSVGESGNKIKIEVIKDSEMEFTIKVYEEQDGKTVLVDDTLTKLNFNEKSSRHFLKVLEDNEHIKASLVDEALKDDFFNEGKSKSGELSFDDLDIKPGDELILSVDGNTNIRIELDKLRDNESYTIDEIATQIQEKVSHISDRDNCYMHFRVEVSEGKFITLVSGSGKRSYSSVEVKESTLKVKLKLGDDETHGSQGLIPVTTEKPIDLQGGEDCGPIDSDHYKNALDKLKKYPEVNIIVLPGRYLKEEFEDAIGLAVSHCDEMKNRMLIIDPEKNRPLKTEIDVTEMIGINSEYTVLYYPWIEMMNPLYDSEKSNPKTVLIPPSAFAAGIWSKIDSKRGVWKAPAGVETNLLGVAKLEHHVEEAHQEILNDLGVNCIRTLPGYGSVIWGSRTLATKSSEWRYIPVRRTAIMLKESIKNNIQWAVFEPNDEPLWAALRTNIGAFMNGLFRAGAFQGKKASDAYFVRCGLNDTMEQGDIDRGKVIIKVGFAPLKPAEFVIVTIEQKVNNV